MNAAEELLNEMIELEEAFIDVLDGNSTWESIQYHTGLPEHRCIQIAELFGKSLDRYRKRKGLK